MEAINNSLEVNVGPPGAQVMPYLESPAVYQAASLHNQAAGTDDGNWFESAIQSLSNAPQYLGLSIASAGVGLANTAIAVGNVFGSKTEQIDMKAWLDTYDTDLAQYYKDNQTGIDTVGFLAGSLVPGIAGVKALNLGQKALQGASTTGFLGKTISGATKLLVPKTQRYMIQAAKEISATNQSAVLLRAGTMKALASGVHKNVLEAAAFETFALATNFKSNYYSDMDTGDLVANFATGVVLGGAIGGALTGLGTVSGIKKTVGKADKFFREQAPLIGTNEALPAGSKGAIGFENRAALEEFIERNAQGPAPGSVLPEGVDAEVVAKKVSNAKDAIAAENNVIRTQVHAMSNNPDVGNKFADAITTMPSKDGSRLMVGTEEFNRVYDVASRRVTKAPKGQQSLGLEGLDELGQSASEGMTWIKLRGTTPEEVGAKIGELPKFAPLADTIKLKRGETLADGIKRTVKKAGESSSSWKKSFNVVPGAATLSKVQARFVASKSWNPKGVVDIVEGDFPLLEAAINKFGTPGGEVTGLRIKSADGSKVIQEIASPSDAFPYLVQSKDTFAKRAISRGRSVEDIAERLNMSPGRINKTAVSDSLADDYLFHQSQAAKLKVSETELFNRPMYMGVKSKTGISELLSNEHIKVEQILRDQLEAAQVAQDAAVASAGSYLGQELLEDAATGARAPANLAERLPENSVIRNALTSATRNGSGARLFTFANGNLGTLESMMQLIGNFVSKMDRTGIDSFNAKAETVFSKLRGSTKLATEFSAINETLANMPVRYGLDPKARRLIPIAHLDDIAAERELRQLGPGVRTEIPINSDEVYEAIALHVEANGARVRGRQELRASLGQEYSVDPRAFYPVKPDPRKLPYHAFVTDPTITGAGKTSMVHAATAQQLDDMLSRIRTEFPQWKTFTKSQGDEFFKAHQRYDYDKTLHDNYIDMSLSSKGVNSQALPVTDGNILTERLTDWHHNQIRRYNKEIVSTKYNAEFNALSRMGREFSDLATSKYPDATAIATSSRRNPYIEYMKTALNISNINEYPALTTVGEYLDAWTSKAWNAGTALMREMKGVDQKILDQVNETFKEAGFKTAYYDAATHLLANRRTDTNVLSRTIRNANSLLATTFLRLDPFNAINNKLGSVILTSTELKGLMRGIETGNKDAAGELVALAKVKIPDTDKFIFSPTKLQMRAYNNFFNNRKLVQQAIDEGFVPADATDAFRVIDNLSFNGTESDVILGKRIEDAVAGLKKLGAFGEKLTGNRLIETLNRFVAYDSTRQITDVAVKHGIITAKEARTYINTIVNQSQVNLNAAQRPLIFQGPIGMAMGLFQSYQFNLMQQLFRYVGEGQGKTAAFMLGMQGSVYGLNGLPGFQAFNEHIIGQAAGNYEHKDITSTLYDAAGYDAANLFLYGLPSNLLQANLYTRGDLTPRSPTILPNSVSDFPVVSMLGKFWGNLVNTAGSLAEGAPVGDTILQALEHNSLNRPLAGIAQTLRGFRNGNVYSTTLGGDLIAANDLWSLATVARIAGGKPIDEAIARDNMFKQQVYTQADAEVRASAGRALRTSLADSGTAPDAQIDSVFEIFMQQGKSIEDFNRFFMQNYLRANTSEAEKIRNSLSSPYSYRMQLLMGGAEEDGLRFSM